MKVWKFEWGGEGMPTRIALYREEHPPSVQTIHDLVLDWLTKEDEEWFERAPNMAIMQGTYNKEKATEISTAFSNSHFWTPRSGYESASLTLEEVR